MSVGASGPVSELEELLELELLELLLELELLELLLELLEPEVLLASLQPAPQSSAVLYGPSSILYLDGSFSISDECKQYLAMPYVCSPGFLLPISRVGSAVRYFLK